MYDQYMPEHTDVPTWVTLTAEEQLVWSDHPSLRSVWGSIVVGLIVIGLGIGGLFLGGIVQLIAIAPIGIGLLMIGVTYFGNRSIQYVLTSEEVYKKTGIFSRNVVNIRLDRIQNTSYTQSLPERLLGFGSIQIDTAGTGGTDISLTDVPNPEHVNGLITEQLDALSTQPEGQTQNA